MPYNYQHEGKVKMRKFPVAVCLFFMMFFTSLSAYASTDKTGEDEQTLHDELCEIGTQIHEQMLQVYSQYKGLNATNIQIKEAGASYQKTLTAKTDVISRYTTDRQQAIMSGVYGFDAAYAALFFQKKDMGVFLNAILKVSQNIGSPLQLSAKMKSLIKNPDSIQDYQAWADASQEAYNKLLTTGTTSDRDLIVGADILYGNMIEALYVVTETIAQADYDPKMLALMNTQHERIDLLMKIFSTFRGNTVFEKEINFNERFDFIGKLHNFLIASDFSQIEVDGIRELVVPARESILSGS
ncbi:MAG: hypothetical protein ACI8PB_003521 [Desulforhopalus sp.]|jgi:hypothetical protein